jgi:hypothetical protein
MLFESDFHAVGKITGDLLYKKYIYIYIYIYGRSRFHTTLFKYTGRT